MNSSDNSSTTSTIRPRNRRLISITDSSAEYPDSSSAGAVTSSTSVPQSRTASPSKFPSRGVSPLPSSRTISNAFDGAELFADSASSALGSRQPSYPGAATSSSSKGSWWGSSWSGLQDITTSVFGSGTETVNGKGKSNGFLGSLPRVRGKHRRVYSGAGPAEWGPKTAGQHIGVGTQEERRKMVEAKKREHLLAIAAAESSMEGAMHRGAYYKRKGSDQVLKDGGLAESQDEDALVYVHHVQPQDTLAGVMIKYGCQQAVFRKVNRFWPNDNIQIRQTVVLPVDACTAKGRRVDPPPVDLFEDLESETTPTHSNSPPERDTLFGGSSNNSRPTLRRQISKMSEHHNDPPWRHESWVLIEGIPDPVEIGRVSRRTMGFFPPARRKSVHYTDDADSNPPSRLVSTVNTPVKPPRSNMESQNSYFGPSSGNPVITSRTPTARRERRPSAADSAFASLLTGPGGVGTLSRSTKEPGPAQDGLNKFFAQHLPALAAPTSQPSHQAGAGPVQFPRRTSFSSATSTASSSAGIGDMGGAIEGWMRKMASKAAAAVDGGPSSGNGAGANTGLSGIGDLIELDGSVIEDHDTNGPNGLLDESFSFGGDSSATPLGRGKASARQDDSEVLRDRFSSASPAATVRARKKDD